MRITLSERNSKNILHQEMNNKLEKNMNTAIFTEESIHCPIHKIHKKIMIIFCC